MIAGRSSGPCSAPPKLGPQAPLSAWQKALWPGRRFPHLFVQRGHNTVPYYAVISRTTLLLVLAHICSSTERMASDHDSSPDPTRHRGVPLPEIGRRLTTIGQGASPHVKPLRYMGHETKKRQIRIGRGGILRMNVKEREPEA